MRDVAVIGAGPVGLTVSLLLARFGLRVALLERATAPDPRPGAVALDDECLRIWQACGLEDVLRDEWAGGEPRATICRYQDRRGRPIMQIRQRVSDLGYPAAAVLRQSRITAALWRQALATPSIDMLLGATLLELQQGDESVRLTAARADGAAERITARWVIACDGGESRSRAMLGVGMPVFQLPHPWLIADIADAGSERLAVICCDPCTASVTLPLPHGARRIECAMLPGESPPIDEQAARERLARAWPEAARAPILAWQVQRFRAGIAERWRVGRVFLAGDAAHVTPPFAGQGLATGLRDASNLSFKIAGVCQEWLPAAVLDTYETERRPHQERMIRLAIRLGRLMVPHTARRAAFQHSAVRALVRVPPIRARLELRGPRLRPRLASGFLTAGGRSGTYLPQPWVIVSGERRTRLDALLGPRMTWLALGSGRSPGRVGTLAIASGDTLLVEGRDFRDPDGELQRCFGKSSLILVRPDRVVHTHIESGDLAPAPARSTPCASVAPESRSPSRRLPRHSRDASRTAQT